MRQAGMPEPLPICDKACEKLSTKSSWRPLGNCRNSLAFTQTLIWRGWVLGIKKIFFYKIVTLMKDRCYIKNITMPYPELFLVVLTK